MWVIHDLLMLVVLKGLEHLMDDVTRKTIKTIETLETIKHNETVEKKEIVQEQSFYLSSFNGSAANHQQMLKSLNKDGSKHALGISINDVDEERALASNLLHENESAIVQKEPLANETGHVHSAHFYLALLHKNDSTGSSLDNNSGPSIPSLEKSGLPGNESVKLAGRMTSIGLGVKSWITQEKQNQLHNNRKQ